MTLFMQSWTIGWIKHTFILLFHDAAVDNAMEEDDELVESTNTNLAEQLDLFKPEAIITFDFFPCRFATHFSG
jgi:hypothetical protein